MDLKLLDEARHVVAVANALQHSLSTLITREWHDHEDVQARTKKPVRPSRGA